MGFHQASFSCGDRSLAGKTVAIGLGVPRLFHGLASTEGCDQKHEPTLEEESVFFIHHAFPVMSH